MSENLNSMINNLPKNYTDYKYVVYREVDGEKWFWGMWDDFKLAQDAAKDIDGYIAMV